ncbi:hypothetical protein COLO4_17880 [Corchorus olitorius]|uniref:Plastid lipid-associated protein/fibrillin conserved domain-containing protein n=1 Tax=Corchorus olitorius TaxID=93759 RepID=A0A1R3JB75_9ROSI|nr:hypothetical protein COLO4_17880 [Corchorus olitorius]
MALSPNLHTIFATLQSSSNSASPKLPATSQSSFTSFQFSSKPLKSNLSRTLSGSDEKWRVNVSFFPAFLKRGKDAKVLKEELLEAIEPLDRGADATPEDQQRVDQLARKLEAVNAIKEPLKSDLLNGKWELIYTTSQSILQTQRPKFLRSIANYQAINTDTLRAQNMESWPFFNQVTADLTPLNSRKVAVKFDFFKIGGLIPIKAPGRARGELEITYLDEELRNSNSQHKSRLRLVVHSQAQGDKWKLTDIDTNAVQERINSWLSKTQHFLTEVTLPLVKTGQRHNGKPDPGNEIDTQDMEDIFLAEQTIPTSTPNGNLSLAAIVSIEQFSRMNGLTGQKMQKIFKALVPKPVYDDARNLVEYCCFRFLSRDASDLHPCLKEAAFQKLIFITMLAWESPYRDANDFHAHASRKASFQGKLVGEEAFCRIAPAISGVADRPTVHNLFKALAGDEKGISLRVWLTYIDELLKVHEGRRSYQIREYPELSEERILCIGSSRKRPVLKWENNMAWPGKLTLTDKALYFEAVRFKGEKSVIRLDLTGHGLQVKKVKVGPFNSGLFDSGVAVSSGPGNFFFL